MLPEKERSLSVISHKKQNYNVGLAKIHVRVGPISHRRSRKVKVPSQIPKGQGHVQNFKRSRSNRKSRKIRVPSRIPKGKFPSRPHFRGRIFLTISCLNADDNASNSTLFLRYMYRYNIQAVIKQRNNLAIVLFV